MESKEEKKAIPQAKSKTQQNESGLSPPEIEIHWLLAARNKLWLVRAREEIDSTAKSSVRITVKILLAKIYS